PQPDRNDGQPVLGRPCQHALQLADTRRPREGASRTADPDRREPRQPHGGLDRGLAAPDVPCHEVDSITAHTRTTFTATLRKGVLAPPEGEGRWRRGRRARAAARRVTARRLTENERRAQRSASRINGPAASTSPAPTVRRTSPGRACRATKRAAAARDGIHAGPKPGRVRASASTTSLPVTPSTGASRAA